VLQIISLNTLLGEAESEAIVLDFYNELHQSSMGLLACDEAKIGINW
jgi:hypothetical protein